MPRSIDGLPVRITPLLTIEVQPGTQLTAAQGFRLAEAITHAAAHLTAAVAGKAHAVRPARANGKAR